MSHLTFTLPGNHIALLHTDCLGAFRTPHTNSTSPTSHQHQPDPTALPGHAVMSANCICRKTNLRCAQLTTRQGCAGARRGRSRWILVGSGTSGGSRWEAAPRWSPVGKQHLGGFPVGKAAHPGAVLTAGSLPSPAAPHRPQHSNPSGRPTYGPGSAAIKRRFPHFQRLCGKG